MEVVYETAAAYNRGGVEAALEYFDRNVELVAPPEWPEDRVGWGHAGARKVYSDWAQQFDDFRLGEGRVIDAGENGVVALFTQRGRIRGSDRELEQPVGMHYEVRAGKITRWHAYLSWDEALKAVGMEE